MKWPSKLNPQGSKKSEEPVMRSKYVDHSQRFVDWVNASGIERTFLGRFASYLDEKLGLRRITVLFLFSMLLSVLLTVKVNFEYTGYRIGDVATTTIKSPVGFE